MTIAASLATVLAPYASLPDSVPAFVSLTGETTLWVPKSLAMVTRVPLMGLGQLLAVSALASARQPSSAPTTAWPPFFRWLATAIASKTLIESLMLAGTGTPWGNTMARPLHIATVVIVTAFVAYAIRFWRAGAMEVVPSIITVRARLLLAAGIAIWLGFALSPYAVMRD